MIRYGLHLRHTLFQAYKQLLEKFPLPSISLLNKILQGGVNSIKALKILRENGKISSDCILMVVRCISKKLLDTIVENMFELTMMEISIKA